VDRSEKCGPPSQRAALVVDFLPCSSAARRRDDAYGPTALKECRICQSWPRIHDPKITKPQSPRWPAALPCSLSGMGEEAATPGQPARAYARFRNVPRQFTLENYRLPLALPQSSGKFRKAHVCCTHSVTDCLTGQLEFVIALCRNCGRCDFLVETRGKTGQKAPANRNRSSPDFQSLRHCKNYL
jgi:hypothetical protein